jgi:glycosyltransferase involved in cell wall biosynthesis
MVKLLITVIIPIYNAENTLKKTVNSILNQSIGFENIELILVDDCSTDNSRDIIKCFANQYANVVPIYSSENSGTPSVPRNIGIKNASSDYIMFIDQDDMYVSTMCEKLYTTIINGHVDLVSCIHHFVDENGEEYWFTNHLKKYGSEIKINSINECPLITKIVGSHTNPCWNKIYKKEFILNKKIFFLEKYGYEDLNFSIECYLKGSFILLNNYVGYLYIFIESLNSSLRHTLQFNELLSYPGGLYSLKKILKEENYYAPGSIADMMLLDYTLLLFIPADLTIKEYEIIFKKCKELYGDYKWDNEFLVYDKITNIFTNIFIKTFSSNLYISYFISKLMKPVLKRISFKAHLKWI